MLKLKKPGTVFLATLVIMYLLSNSSFIPMVRAAGDDSQFFPETQHTVSGKFLAYWQSNGALPVFGYPLTDPQNEVDPETGKTFLTQWFERARFELHPENAGTRYEILTGLLGKDLRREALSVDPSFQPAVQTASNPGGYFFPETGHNVGARFLNYWQGHGGLERFGFPVSEEHFEVDPQTGQSFSTQWFERARFEYHPENKGTAYEVLLGLLGNEIKKPASQFTFAWKLGVEYQFKSPKDLAVDQNGNLYVADGDNFSLPVFHTDGRFIKRIGGTPGEDELFGNFGTPTLVDVVGSGSNTVIYTNRCSGSPSSLGCSIQELDSAGNLIRRWSPCTQQNNHGSCIFPDFLAVDNQGNSYVTTYGSNTLLSFDKSGNFRTGWALSKQLSMVGVKVDKATDEIIVADQTTNRIWTFDKNGHLLTGLGGPGNQDGQFKQINALAVGPDGSIYVADSDLHRIQKFSSQGQFLGKWGGYGEADGQFHYIEALAVDQNGDIFVSNFDPNPPLLEQVVKFRQIRS